MSRKRHKKRFRLLIIIIILLIGIAGASIAVKGLAGDKEPVQSEQKNNDAEQTEAEIKEPEKKPDISINIKATGDIMFHPSQIEGAYDSKTGTYDFKNSFRAVKNILSEADLAIANFEGTTGGNKVYDYQGYPLFNAPDEVLDAMKDAGFDVLSTVNNHSLDTRKAGVIRTIEQIQARGMDTIGTYSEKPKTRVLIKDVKGIKLAFIAYTEMVNGLESLLSQEDLNNMINIISEEKIKEDIAYAKEQKADVIIAYMHWGNEYARVQSDRQKSLADMMIKEGVDIILGSHPHVIQESKILDIEGRKKFIAYSMGNFLSNQRVETLVPYGMSEEISKYTEDGVIIDIEIEKKGETGEVSVNDIGYTPVWVYKGTTSEGRTEHVVYPIIEFIENSDVNENSKARMNRSYNDTMAKMDEE
jgi:poly-gamma-glutamate synthesis protein (capsule biosynthesis protein)